ncbi:MAG: helix-turn-helix transcriptional regulator [Candidatus Cyclobacteriaceae bacterium M3_2C_046]
MLPQQKILRVFKLISLLKRPGGRTAKDLAVLLDVTVRSVQRYIKLLEDVGFLVEQDWQNRYFICNYEQDSDEPMNLTAEECNLVNQTMRSAAANHPLTTSVLKKIYVQGELFQVPEYLERARISRFISQLQKAIDNRKQVTIKSYHSAHSQQISDRLIEPFAFTENYTVIQAFEPVSAKNKFFKLERIHDLIILDKKQEHLDQHQQQHADCFGFVDAKSYQVVLELNLKAYLALRENYPAAISYLQVNQQKYLFDGPVYSLEGVGRFLMGYLDQIRILQPPELINYIQNLLDQWIMRHKLSRTIINFSQNSDHAI